MTLVDQRRVNELREALEETRKPDEPGLVLPKVIHKVAPSYPERARKDKLEGEIAVMTTIDKQGIPRAPTVLRMTPGAEDLAAAAVDTVQNWRYEPGTLNGEPVDVEFTVFVRFMLE